MDGGRDAGREQLGLDTFAFLDDDRVLGMDIGAVARLADELDTSRQQRLITVGGALALGNFPFETFELGQDDRAL
jgi:hypothetical protein